LPSLPASRTFLTALVTGLVRRWKMQPSFHVAEGHVERFLTEDVAPRSGSVHGDPPVDAARHTHAHAINPRLPLEHCAVVAVSGDVAVLSGEVLGAVELDVADGHQFGPGRHGDRLGMPRADHPAAHHREPNLSLAHLACLPWAKDCGPSQRAAGKHGRTRTPPPCKFACRDLSQRSIHWSSSWGCRAIMASRMRLAERTASWASW